MKERSNTQEDTFRFYSGLNFPLQRSFKPLLPTVGQPLFHSSSIKFPVFATGHLTQEQGYQPGVVAQRIVLY